jgi:hypothetical protein
MKAGRNKTSWEDRNSIITGRETGTLGSDYIINTQLDTIIHNKIQTHTWIRRTV